MCWRGKIHTRFWKLVAGFLRSTMFPRFICVVACILLLNTIPAYAAFYFSSWFIHQLMDIWSVSTFWLLWIMPRWILNTSFLWTYSWAYAFWVELLGHVIAVCWPALGTAKLFSKVVVPVFILANNTWGFQVLSIVCNTCYCLSL